MTQSLERPSLICTLVVDNDKVRVLRYSALRVMPELSVASMPKSGANYSLMLTVGTLQPSSEEPLVSLV